MASASDVRDILSLPARQATAPAVKSGPPKARAKRLDGITRELYALMGDNAPAITLARPKMKERPKFRAPATKWAQKPFTNSARKDGLQLSHWVKETDDPTEEYKFAKFNTSSNPLSYTAEEYDEHLKVDGWSRAETDFLFELCRDFDLRFIVIGDRYLDSEFDERTLEDLKERYYDCCRKLILARPAEDEATRNQLAQTYAFDKAREVSRKEYLRSLIKRSREQIQEELMLYTESRRLEQEYTTMSREREDLLRSLAGPGALQSIPAHMFSFGPTGSVQSAAQTMAQFPPGKRRRLEGDEFGAAVAGGAGKKPRVNAAFDAEHYITRHTGPQGPAGSSLRTQRSLGIKAGHVEGIRKALAEMGISQRLVMPTSQNMERLEALLIALGNLLDLKKHLDRIEYEVNVSTQRNDSLTAGDGTSREKSRELSVPGDDASGGVTPKAGASSHRKRSVSISSLGSDRSNKRTRK